MSWKELVQTLHFIDSTNSKYSRGGGEEYSSKGGRDIVQRRDIIQRGWDIFKRGVGYIPEGGDIFKGMYFRGGGYIPERGIHFRGGYIP